MHSALPSLVPVPALSVDSDLGCAHASWYFADAGAGSCIYQNGCMQIIILLALT